MRLEKDVVTCNPQQHKNSRRGLVYTINTFEIYTKKQFKCNKQRCCHNCMAWRPLSKKENLNTLYPQIRLL